MSRAETMHYIEAQSAPPETHCTYTLRSPLKASHGQKCPSLTPRKSSVLCQSASYRGSSFHREPADMRSMSWSFVTLATGIAKGNPAVSLGVPPRPLDLDPLVPLDPKQTRHLRRNGVAQMRVRGQSHCFDDRQKFQGRARPV